MAYDGPHAAFATLGGSPTWGLGDHFAELAAAQGCTRLGLFRPLTPYGTGPQVKHYRGPQCEVEPRASRADESETEP